MDRISAFYLVAESFSAKAEGIEDGREDTFSS